VTRRFIVEADGGSRGNPGPAGYGAVVRDAATGETLREAAEFLGTATNNVAEYRGLIAGLRAARALDPTAVVRVRMDSKLVVEQMSGRWKVKHPDMRPLAAEARGILPPGQVSYEWVPREKNKHADRLANEAMDAGRHGRRWEPGRSRAELEVRSALKADPSVPAAGAAAARAALRGTREGADAPRPVAEAGGAAGDPVSGAAAGQAAAERGESAAGNGWSGGADLGTPTTFVLLRHGETPLTPHKRFSGSGGSDPDLSDQGRRQARAAAEALAARGTVQAVVTSPLARCRQTAAIVADRLGLPVEVEDGLRETDFGAWEGLTFGEVRERHPEDLNAWLASAEARPTGGGESFATVSRRVAAARDALTERHSGRTVLLVTHVTPIKTLVRLALGAPPESLFRMELSAASLSVVAYFSDGTASLRLLNDTAHLRG
jgi:probable phosphoglycerate mutase